MQRYRPTVRSTNGIQEVARSIRVSSTSKIRHFVSFGQHQTQPLSENCPKNQTNHAKKSEALYFFCRISDRRFAREGVA